MNAYKRLLASLTVLIFVCARDSQASSSDVLSDGLSDSIWCAPEDKPLWHMEREAGHLIYGVETCFSLNGTKAENFTMLQLWRIEKDGRYAGRNGMTVKINGTTLNYQQVNDTGDFTYPFPSINIGGTLTKRGKYLDMTQFGYMKDGSLLRYSNRFVRVKQFPWLLPHPAASLVER